MEGVTCEKVSNMGQACVKVCVLCVKLCVLCVASSYATPAMCVACTYRIYGWHVGNMGAM